MKHSSSLSLPPRVSPPVRPSDFSGSNNCLLLRHHALDFVYLRTELLLFLRLFIKPFSNAIEMVPRTLLPELLALDGMFALSGRCRSHGLLEPEQLLLLLDELVVFEFAWREDALADVFGVVLHALHRVLRVDDDFAFDHLAVVVSEMRVEQVLLARSLLSDRLLAAERVERVVLRAVARQELFVGESLHGLRLTAHGDVAVVDSVASLALISHRVGIAHVHGRAIAHKTVHQLDVLLCLVDARVGTDLDLGLVVRVTAQSERRVRDVTCVPEVVASLGQTPVYV